VFDKNANALADEITISVPNAIHKMLCVFGNCMHMLHICHFSGSCWYTTAMAAGICHVFL